MSTLIDCLLGGITGAGARITGTVGDVFAKLTFDEEFIDKRQQQKSRPPRLSQKLGGFARVSCHYYACTQIHGFSDSPVVYFS